MTDPLHEIPADIISAGKRRLEVPGVLHCFHAERAPLKSLGGTDILVKKYNSTRHLIWANRIGGVSNDNASTVTTDLQGNIFVAGNVYGLSTLSSKFLQHGKDSFHEVRLLGSQSSNRVRRMFVSKYDRAGKLLWASEVGACIRRNCGIDAIAVSPDGSIVVTGQFFGAISVGLMCSSSNCITSEPVSSHIVQQSNIECSQQGMESFNETCNHPIPAATLLSATTCKEPERNEHLCNTDTFMGMLDQNGTLMWAKNIRRNQTWMRHTPLVQPFVEAFVVPWERSAMLAYRAIPEKLAASTDPETTILLLYDAYLDVSNIHNGLKDAYHIEIQLNRTRLSRTSIQACIATVNSAFMALKAAVLLDALSFGLAISTRAAFIMATPSVVQNHTGVFPPAMKVDLANGQGYKDSVYQFYSRDRTFSEFRRETVIGAVNTMNTKIDQMESVITSYDIAKIQEAIVQPGLLFSKVSRPLLRYYAGRIAAMRQGWGRQLQHRELQMVFLTDGSVFSNYPARPTAKEIQQGGQSLILRISSDKFMPMTNTYKNMVIDNLVSSNVFDKGFETKIKPYLRSTEGLEKIVQSEARDTITITFPELGAMNYTIPEPETIIMSIPPALTEYGSAYPFYAQFYIRRDPIGLIWNTETVNGDLYARPIVNDFKAVNHSMTIFLAGDQLLPLTDARKITLINNIVPSGNDVTEPLYMFDLVRTDLRANLDRLTSSHNDTVLTVAFRAVPRYDIITAETITVTIPKEITVKGFSHAIGSFAIKPTPMGSIMSSMSANNLGSGGYDFKLRIAGDRYAPMSRDCVTAIINEMHSSNIPFVANGFIKKVVPILLLAENYLNWDLNNEGNTLTLSLPQTSSSGYNPQQKETVIFIIPAICTLSVRRHWYAPFIVSPGDGERPNPVYREEVNGARYLPENAMRWT